MKIKSILPNGMEMVHDDGHVHRHLTFLERLFYQGDVHAVTVHRASGDFRYEQYREEGE